MRPALRQILLGGARLKGFASRSSVAINNSSGISQANYQVNVPVTFKTGMNADFSDVRFTDSDGRTLLSHWRQDYIASTSATFWVKVPSLPVAAKSIWMYYGNSGAVDVSNGFATFTFFDDFQNIVPPAAAPDASIWDSTITGTGSAFPKTVRQSVLTVANGGQGLCGDGTNFWLGKSNGVGVNSTIYEYDYAGSAVRNFAGPAHGASIDVRADTGNLLISSGSTDAAVVWEVTKAGAFVQGWYFGGVDYGVGATVTYYGSNQIILGTADVSNNQKFRLITLGAGNGSAPSSGSPGTYTLGQVWGPVNVGLPQGLKWLSGSLYFLVDNNTGGSGSIYKFALKADGTITTQYIYQNLFGPEREGLTFDGTNWYYANSNFEIGLIDLPNQNVLATRTQANPGNSAYVSSKVSFAPPFVIGARAQLTNSNFPVVLAASDGDPDGGANLAALGRFHGANSYLYARQAKSSVQSEAAYPGTTNYTSYQTYEIKVAPASVQYFQNAASLGTAISTNVPTASLKVTLGGITASGSSVASGNYSWVYVRTYQATEPTVTVN